MTSSDQEFILTRSCQDHGKTSLTDALLATNGIISPRLAGKVRYLDSRPDEQLRGITMESSAISLHFSMLRRESEKEAQLQQEYLINLIDSPGHIDFSSEVSVASRLCDGAVVLVDAVEGVCSQTVTVLRETWIEHLQPILVINKIDRLVTELKMSPSEAYAHLSKILEQVNAVVGTFFQGERMEQDLRWRERIEEQVAAKTAKTHAKAEQDVSAKAAATTRPEGEGSADDKPATVGFVEKDDEDIYFAPEKNNVVFSSALDGWGFTVRQFATLYEKKLGIKKAALEKVLWGDYYLDPKTRRVLGHKHLKGRSLKPMFVQLVLENIWAVYDATTGRGNAKGSVAAFLPPCIPVTGAVAKAHWVLCSDPSSAQKILDSLNITLPTHVLRSKDPRSVLTSLFAAWLPLSTAILVSVVEYLPSPLVAQAARLPSIIHASPGAAHVDERLRAAMVESKSEKGQPVVAYVSKMIAVPESQLPHNRRRQGGLTAEEAREAGRRKRAEIAKAHALASAAEADGTGGLAEMMHDTSLGTSRNGIHEEASEPVVEDREHLIGFSRIYSGVLSVGDDVYILRPKFSPAYPDAHPQPIRMTVTALYLMMGRNLESLDSVPAGVVFGVAGLEGHILKSGTLCSQVAGGINLAGLNMGSQPIVRVALEPTNPGDLDKMIHGLRLLEQSDPSAEYEVLESGEHVIATAGELHLERCLKDLRERFAKCELQAGEPIVPYRETIVSASEMAPPKHKDLSRGTVLAVTASKQLTVRLNVRPLPAAVTEFLIENVSAIRRLQSQQRAKEEQERKKRRQQRQRQQQQQQQQQQQADDGEGLEGLIGGPNEQSTPSPEDDDGGEKQPRDLRTLSLADFRHGLQQAFSTAKTDKDLWNDVVERVVAFGPRRVGPNLLIDSTEAGLFRRLYVGRRSAGSSSPLVVLDNVNARAHRTILVFAMRNTASRPSRAAAAW